MVKYFAYGSNMSLLRLKSRVPSAAKLGIYSLSGYQLRFHKKSIDGSSKCDAFYTGYSSDQVLGVLFDIAPSEKANLDKIEGLGVGYNEKSVTITNKKGHQIEAYIYVAIDIDVDIKPYDWYLQHVITGAIEADFPSWYLAEIQAIESKPDHNQSREHRELEIYL